MNDEEKVLNQGEANSTTSDNTPAVADKKCIVKNNLKDKLDKQKKANQSAEIEAKNDQELSDALKAGDEELFKLYNDLTEALSKYESQHEKLKQQKDCMVKKTESARAKIPDDIQENIKALIASTDKNLEKLKTQQKNLQSLTFRNGKSDDGDYHPIEKKPEVHLDFDAGNLNDIMTLMRANDEFERSKKYYAFKAAEFKDLMNTHNNINDNLKKAGDYQEKAEKAKQEGKQCRMYAYTLIILKILEETKIYDSNELGTKLRNALENLRSATTDKCIREYVKNKVKDSFDLINQYINETEKDKYETIIEKIVSNPL